MSDYILYDDFLSGDGEEGCLVDGIFEILKPEGLKQRTEEIIKEIHDRDYADNKYWRKENPNDMYCAKTDRDLELTYDTYSEAYIAVLEGETIISLSLDEEVLIQLCSEGYINNGLIRQLNFYQDKYNRYWIANITYRKLIESDTDTRFYTEQALIKELISKGVIQLVHENSYVIN